MGKTEENLWKMKKLKGSGLAYELYSTLEHSGRTSMILMVDDQIANRTYNTVESMIRLELVFRLQENLSGEIWRALDKQR